jgi:hypothetical protein
LANGLLAAGAIINTYDILDRYIRLGEITRQQAGLQLGVNAIATGGTYLVGEGAAAIVGYYTGAAAGVAWAGVAVGLTALTFEIMVAQGAANNMIEGQAPPEAIWNARDATLDSLLGIFGSNHEDWDNYLYSRLN